jgi:hypothetical protein
MSDDKYFCIRKCFLHGRLWEVGERFSPVFPGAQPNRHFALNGVAPPDAKVRSVFGPGDDKRSTRQMVEALKEYGKEVPKAMEGDRKALFSMLVEVEGKAVGKKALAEPAPAAPVADMNNAGPGHNAARDPSNPILSKQFSSMTPDEIDGLTAGEMREKLAKPPYSLDLGSGYVKKDDLVRRGVAIEEQIARSAQR